MSSVSTDFSETHFIRSYLTPHFFGPFESLFLPLRPPQHLYVDSHKATSWLASSTDDTILSVHGWLWLCNMS